jgi:RNA exonuclease 4
MEHTGLSSNWKKLQVTLKGSTTPKEKKDTRPPQNGLKRKRAEAAIEKRADRPRKFSKVKSMTDIVDAKGLGGERRRSLGATEKPVPQVVEKKQPRDGKVNEGLNET